MINEKYKTEIKIKAKYPELIKSDIKVTIGILVSNHIKYIRKAMEAIKPLLDKVPSELIVVDTVGPEKSDGSLDVVKEYTKNIYHFDWINDFSAARNVAMEHARGEWFMYFDDDEYFDDVTEFIEFFNSGECDKYFYGLYYTADYTAPGVYEKGIAGRMIRRTVATRFVGRVHEQFNEGYTPVKQFNVFTHHFGYLYANPEQEKAKMERNMRLLEQELADHGPNAKVCAQIVGQQMGEMPEEASKRCTAFIKALEGTGELETSCGQWLLMANVRFMVRWGSLAGILDIEKQLLENYHLQETARMVMAWQVAVVAYDDERYDLAAEKVKQYFELFDWLNSHTDEKTLQTQLDFPSFFMERKLYKVTMIGVGSENHLGNYEKAYSYVKRLEYNYCSDFEGTRKVVAYTLNKLEDKAPEIEWYRRFYRDEIIDDPALHKFLPRVFRERLDTDNPGE